MRDNFLGESLDDYREGFPWHPHRGIETITVGQWSLVQDEGLTIACLQ